METTELPDQRSGDVQLGRALDVLAANTGAFAESEKMKVHALLAIAAYQRDLVALLRDLMAVLRDQAAKPNVEMVSAARVAEMVGDIIAERVQL